MLEGPKHTAVGPVVKFQKGDVHEKRVVGSPTPKIP